MRESKEFKTLAAKSSPRRSAWSFVKFESGGPCKKGQTAAKTGCTPASGEGTKKEESEGPDIVEEDEESYAEKTYKETIKDAKKTLEELETLDLPKAVSDKLKEDQRNLLGKMEKELGEIQGKKESGESIAKDAEKAAKEGVDIMEDVLGFPKEDRAEIKSDKKEEKEEREPKAKPSALPFNKENVDENAHRELQLYLQNDADIYRQRIEPMMKNVQRKIKSGKYDHDLAPKLWNYAVDEAAKKYAKEYGGKTSDIFNRDTRRKLAHDLADEYRDEITENIEYTERAHKEAGRPPSAGTSRE